MGQNEKLPWIPNIMLHQKLPLLNVIEAVHDDRKDVKDATHVSSLYYYYYNSNDDMLFIIIHYHCCNYP